jgi:hypothetical protein
MAKHYDETVRRAAPDYYAALGLALTRGKSEISIRMRDVPAWEDLPEEARDAHYQAAELVLGARAGDVGKAVVGEAAKRYLDHDMPATQRLAAMKGFSYLLQYIGARDDYHERIGAAEATPLQAPNPGYPALAEFMESPDARGGILKAVEHLMVNRGCKNQDLGRMVVGLPEGSELEYAKIGAEIRSWLLRIWPGGDEDQRRMNAAMSSMAGRAAAPPSQAPGADPHVLARRLERVRKTCEDLLNAEARAARGAAEDGDPLTDTERAVYKIAGAAGFRTEPARPYVPAVEASPARVTLPEGC